jgi:uncharacterized phiE125 gp8 family phage protein
MRIPKVLVQPTVEPITLEQARLHLRLDAYDSPPTHPDDTLIQALITASREWCEAFTGRSLAVKTLELALDCFPGVDPITLPGAPVHSISSFVYIDGDGVQQDLAGYQFDTYTDPPRILPAVDTYWPATRSQMNALRIRYVAGFTLPEDSPDVEPLPKSLLAAMLLTLGHLYENREDTSIQELSPIPMGAQALMRPWRLHTGLA